MFWYGWCKKYLSTIVQRRKWYRHWKNLKFGDLVIIKSENRPRSHWSLGCVIETYPKTELTRPSWKLRYKTITKCMKYIRCHKNRLLPHEAFPYTLCLMYVYHTFFLINNQKFQQSPRKFLIC